MLSRAAERVYWTGRYLERTENTARIVQQYSQLLLDLPDEVGVDWAELVGIVGATEAFEASGRERRESDILEFLLVEMNGAPSLSFSLKMARDNIRNTRDLLPHESWESVNELHHWAGRNLGHAVSDRDRFEVLSEVIARCLQINGILTGTMSHNSPYQFLRLGQNIERADMTSRVIDVAAAYIRHNERLVRRYGSSLWTNILKSVSGFQMYRQYCQPDIEGARVIEFLLTDRAFPRAIATCIDRARTSCHALPRGAGVLVSLDDVEDILTDAAAEWLDADGVSRLMDRTQKRLARTHDAVVDTWFLPGDAG